MKYWSLAFLAFGQCAVVMAQHPRLDGPLSDLVDSDRAGRAPFVTPAIAGRRIRTAFDTHAMRDAQGRILVDIYLDGSVPLNQFIANLTAAGGNITGVNPDFRFGAVSAYLPVASIRAISGFTGVSVMTMTPRPQRNAGLVTSQGVKAVKSDTANGNGYLGTGITVGVLSDSYNTSPASFTAIRASNDIASGDLRAPKLVVDLPASSSNIDEGRAMMQIVHDVAPNADLCFETAFAGASAFAANIRDLRTNPACAADVIVDDVVYFDEPFYSDGQIALAVNDVVTSSTLAGKKVAYFSSAGNWGALGSRGSIDVPNATFSTTPTGLGNINLATTNTCSVSPNSGHTRNDKGGGWLDFGGGVYYKTVTYSNSGSRMILQWDDPFYQAGVTTDLNWFMFNSAGNCVFTFSANNFTTDRGMEYIALSGGSSGTYRIMIARTTSGSHLSSRVRMVNIGGWGGGDFTIAGNPATFGHSSAAGAISVAAYVYSSPYSANPVTPAFEGFSSPGPATIVFNAAGTRMATPETRKKPDLAAPDGGDTTFFYPGSDPDGSTFPNFFGTSAAAPHAAGVAALLLQKAGGPGSLTPAQIKSVLQTTAPARTPPVTGGTPAKGYSKFDGFGLIDAVAALAKIP
jgi:hypothetical protein